MCLYLELFAVCAPDRPQAGDVPEAEILRREFPLSAGSKPVFHLVKWVRGERMKKRVVHSGRGRFPARLLFLAGFLLGALLPNAFWRLEWRQKTLVSLYLLELFGERARGSLEYFILILRMRGSVFLLAALCGITVFGVPLAVLGMLCCGMIPGMLLAMSILQFGMAGGAVGLGLLLPQYLIYLPAACTLLNLVYRESLEIWRGHGILPRRLSGYGAGVCVLAAVCAAGMLAEAYLNPLLIRFLFDRLDIFRAF